MVKLASYGTENMRNACRETRGSDLKEGLYRIWCGANRLGDSGVNTLCDNSAFVNPAG